MEAMMLTRRQLIKAGGAAALVTPFTGFASSLAQVAGEPLFPFGVVADPQYAPVPPRRTRYYANSLWKLSESIEALNNEELEFVVTLGDIIDRHWESYTHILPALRPALTPALLHPRQSRLHRRRRLSRLGPEDDWT
jgi:hypothetical protein